MEIFDRLGALRRANGDQELLKERCESYSVTAEAAMKSLERAVAERDAVSLDRLARKLQTDSVDVGAEGMESLASQLMKAGQVTDWSEAGKLLTKLGMELGWFQRIIDEKACSGNL